MTMTTIIASVIALFVGIAIGWFIMRLAMKYRAQNIIKEAEAEAEVIKKDKILQAKEKFLQIKAEHEKQAAEYHSFLPLSIKFNKRFDYNRTMRSCTGTSGQPF